MKEKFIQGGWYLEFDNCDEEGFLESAEFTGAILDTEGNGIGHVYGEKNARIMSAAPEMYNALCVIERVLPDCPYKTIVHAALKKARGEA